MRCVSIEVHDVCPPFEQEVGALLDLLRELGVSHPTLLVVPRYTDSEGRTWPLSAAPALCDRIGGLAGEGAEIVLHGFSHRAPRAPPPILGPWLLHHVISRGEAEFADLPYAEARRRMDAGLGDLAPWSLRPRGFIAPVWQLSAEALRALIDAGFLYTAGFRRVRFLRGGEGRDGREASSVEGLEDATHTLRSPVLTYCAPAVGVDHAKRLVMRTIAWRSAHAPLVRVALHPEDARAPGRLRHIRGQLQSLLHQRRVWSYSEGLAALVREAA